MAAPVFRRLRPNQQPTAADYNALAAAFEASQRIGGSALGGDIGVTQGFGGVQLLDGREKGHWAGIGGRGAGAAYAHVQVVSNGDGTFESLPEDPNYAWGTTTYQPAWEVNGDTSVRRGSIVWVWPDPSGQGWLFESGGTPESGSPGGDCGALETVTFDVVTNIDFANCSFTRRRVTLSGCGLSVRLSGVPGCDPPSGLVYACASQPDGLPRVWSLTVGEFDDPAFAALEGVWTLTHQYGCVWNTGGGTPGWTLIGDGDGWALTGQSGEGTVRYVPAVQSTTAVGCGSVAVPHDGEDGSGVTEPASLTLVPA